MFKLLDSLHHMATGLDGLPAWFLRLRAPAFYKPLCQLFNQSLSTSTVPRQWKHACIRQIAKVSAPTRHADFRPISITPVLTRVLKKSIVLRFLYPAFLSPPQILSFSDQFAFRPTGSHAAAIISLLHTVTSVLLSNPYVIVISLTSARRFRRCGIRLSRRNWPSSICQTRPTTGWSTSSAATRTVPCTVIRRRR